MAAPIPINAEKIMTMGTVIYTSDSVYRLYVTDPRKRELARSPNLLTIAGADERVLDFRKYDNSLRH
jgi:hypothetical protein